MFNTVFKENKVGGWTVSKAYYTATVIKSGICDRTDELNRVESPEIDTHKYGHLIFDKGGKVIKWSKGNL